MKGTALWVAKHLCLHQGNGGDGDGTTARGLSGGHPPPQHDNQYPQGAIAWMDGRNQDNRLGGHWLCQADLLILPSRPLIPVDMVVNAMMVSMAAHPEEQAHIIYHVTSSVRNPAPYAVLAESAHRYFFDNPPCTGRNGERLRLNKMRFFKTVEWLRLYMAIKYKIPLEMLRLVALCGVLSQRYNKLSRKYRFVMQLIELYAPFSLFKGRFDDMNLEKLRMAMNKDQNNNEAYYFDFDPKSINWDDYFYSVHIPGVLKYMCDGVILN